MKNPSHRYVWWAPYQQFEHLNLILNGWREHECVYADNEVWIKLSKVMQMEKNTCADCGCELEDEDEVLCDDCQDADDDEVYSEEDED